MKDCIVTMNGVIKIAMNIWMIIGGIAIMAISIMYAASLFKDYDDETTKGKIGTFILYLADPHAGGVFLYIGFLLLLLGLVS